MRGLVGGLARTPRDLVGGLAAGPGKGLSGHWLGTNRWVVPGENPETHSGILLTAQLEKGNSGRVEKLVAQGRRVPMERPLHGPTAGLLANQLERTAMCVGECLPDQVQTALGDDELKHQVTELDPAPLFSIIIIIINIIITIITTITIHHHSSLSSSS